MKDKERQQKDKPILNKQTSSIISFPKRICFRKKEPITDTPPKKGCVILNFDLIKELRKISDYDSIDSKEVKEVISKMDESNFEIMKKYLTQNMKSKVFEDILKHLPEKHKDTNEMLEIIKQIKTHAIENSKDTSMVLEELYKLIHVVGLIKDYEGLLRAKEEIDGTVYDSEVKSPVNKKVAIGFVINNRSIRVRRAIRHLIKILNKQLEIYSKKPRIPSPLKPMYIKTKLTEKNEEDKASIVKFPVKKRSENTKGKRKREAIIIDLEFMKELRELIPRKRGEITTKKIDRLAQRLGGDEEGKYMEIMLEFLVELNNETLFGEILNNLPKSYSEEEYMIKLFNEIKKHAIKNMQMGIVINDMFKLIRIIDRLKKRKSLFKVKKEILKMRRKFKWRGEVEEIISAVLEEIDKKLDKFRY